MRSTLFFEYKLDTCMMQLFIVFKLLVKVRNMLLSIRFQIQKNKFHIFDIFKKTIHRTDNTPLVLHHSLNNYLKRASYFILHFQKIKTFRNILKLIDSVIYIYIYIQLRLPFFHKWHRFCGQLSSIVVD